MTHLFVYGTLMYAPVWRRLVLGNHRKTRARLTGYRRFGIRGQVYPFRGGVLIPTFHPAAILRGGATQMAQMRADLVRAKQAIQAATPGPEAPPAVAPAVAPAADDATLFD